VFAPLGIKFGSKIGNSALQTHYLGTKAIALRAQAIYLTDVAQFKISKNEQSYWKHRE